MIQPFDQTLLVGLGSPFGDDQIGWRVAEAIERIAPPGLIVKRARSADDILDWLDGIDRLIICDACQGIGPVGTIRRWQWPTSEIAPVRFSGSHDLGLAAVLTLAEQLRQLPQVVILWGVEGHTTSRSNLPLDVPLSATLEAALPQIVSSIANDLKTALVNAKIRASCHP